MQRFLISLLFSLAAIGAHAQGVATFTYQRAQLELQRAHPPALPALPWQEGAAPQPDTSRLALAMDIRPSTSLYHQEGWMSLASIPAGEGKLFVFSKPQVAHIGHMEVYQPLDVLWVDATGKITSIAPGLNLSQLSQPLVDSRPSKAILLLGGQEAARLSITPGDRLIDSDFFSPPPAIISAKEPSGR